MATLPYAVNLKLRVNSFGLIGNLWIGVGPFQKGLIRQASMLPGSLKGISQARGAFSLTPLSLVAWLSLRFLYEVLWGSPHCEVGNTMLFFFFVINFPRALNSKTSHLHALHLNFYKSQNPWGLIGFGWNLSFLPKIYRFLTEACVCPPMLPLGNSPAVDQTSYALFLISKMNLTLDAQSFWFT